MSGSPASDWNFLSFTSYHTCSTPQDTPVLGEVLVWLLNPVWVDFQAGWTAESLAAQNAGQDCGGVEQAWGGAAPPDEVSAVLCRFPEQPTPSQAWGAV